MLGEFRDPIARVGGNPGFLYRSAKLSETNARERDMLARILDGGQVIDLRTPGRAAKEPDPRLPGVCNVAIPLPPTAYVPYSAIVTLHTAALRQVMRAMFDRGPTLVHCTEGKDRTGIVVALAMLVLGYSVDQARAEFMSTVGALESNWNDMIGALLPDPHTYARKLLDLTPGE